MEKVIPLTEVHRGSLSGVKSFLVAAGIVGICFGTLRGREALLEFESKYINQAIKQKMLETSLSIEKNDKIERAGMNLEREDLERVIYTLAADNEALQSKLELIRTTVQ
jgi:hypothetical protein